MPSALAEVTRGGAVESIHYGVVAVVDVSGALVASAGDSDHFAFFRSSAKPFQAVPLLESGAVETFDLTPAELALCCASHHAERHHQDEVATLLAKLGLDAGALRCGAPLPADPCEAARVELGMTPPSPLQCDCSGKHAGMLAACRQLGLPIETYLEPEHPLQRQIRLTMAEMLRLPATEIADATDGCSLPTFGAPIRAFATAYATLARPAAAPPGRGREHADALLRLGAAMTAHPENVAGTGSLVTNLMAVSRGEVIAKSGAEGLLCLAIPSRGWGIAIRVLDGSVRAHAVIACHVLESLDLIGAEVVAALRTAHDSRIFNHNRRHVGDIRAAFTLRKT